MTLLALPARLLRPASTLALITATAVAQPAPPTPTAPPPTPSAATRIPPDALLGRRAEAARRRVPIAPVLLIVPDERSFLAAINFWTVAPPAAAAAPDTLSGIRFPILIDDGSHSAIENIARFSRAFKPQRTLRWTAPATAQIPADAAQFAALLRRTHAATWGTDVTKLASAPPAATADALRARFNELGHSPPGIVAISTNDPAWTGGLALAALRGQVLLTLDPSTLPTDGTNPISFPQLLALDKRIRSAATISGFAFDTLGDQLDSITLAANCSPRVMIDPKDSPALSPPGQAPFVVDPKKAEPLALTDLLGRDLPSRADRRWAWAGQLTGTAASSLYRAMSAFFLTPESVASFDGYDDTDPFRRWSPTAAARTLASTDGNRWAHTDLSSKARSLAAWRAATHMGVDAGLMLVTTSGMQGFFELKPGNAQVGDIPFLTQPTAVYFVHSWSAIQPVNRWTVAGRFLDRGAHIYVGSVHEPFLQAFIPTPALVQRLLGGSPIAAAIRYTDAPPWRVALLGDPLATITRKPAPPTANSPPLARGPADLPKPIADAATDLSDAVREDLKAKRYAPAIATLRTLGRDADIARLIPALLADDPAAVTPPVAAAALMPLFRAAAHEPFARCFALAYDTLPDPAKWEAVDALWHLLGPASRRPLTAAAAELLAAHPRTDAGDALARDLAELAPALAVDLKPGPARTLLAAARDKAPADQRAAYDKALLTIAPR